MSNVNDNDPWGAPVKGEPPPKGTFQPDKALYDNKRAPGSVFAFLLGDSKSPPNGNALLGLVLVLMLVLGGGFYYFHHKDEAAQPAHVKAESKKEEKK